MFKYIPLVLIVLALTGCCCVKPEKWQTYSLVTPVSVTPDGIYANGKSWSAKISGNGDYVVFVSEATDLGPWSIPVIPPNNPPPRQIYVRNLLNNTTELVSVNDAGSALDRWTADPSISSNGRYVSYRTDAGNVVKDFDSQMFDNIYVRDRNSKKNIVASRLTLNNSSSGMLVADGNGIYFNSIKHVDQSSRKGIYYYDLKSEKTYTLSRTSGYPLHLRFVEYKPYDVYGNMDQVLGTLKAVSNDGSKIVFISNQDLLPHGSRPGSMGFMNGVDNRPFQRLVLHYDIASDTISTVHATSGSMADVTENINLTLSDNNFVVFDLFAGTPITSPWKEGVFLYGPERDCVAQLYRRRIGTLNGDSVRAVMSSNKLVFQSTVDDWSGNIPYQVFPEVNVSDNNGASDIYMLDITHQDTCAIGSMELPGETSVVSRGGKNGAIQSNDDSHGPSIDKSGNNIVFLSNAKNLSNINQANIKNPQVYVRRLLQGCVKE